LIAIVRKSHVALRPLLAAAALLLPLALSARGSAAQETRTPATARIHGRVVEQQGRQRRLPGITVTLQPGGLQQTTDARGLFLFANLEAGTYVLHIDAPSYAVRADSVPLTLGQVLDVTVKLAPRDKTAEALDIMERFVGLDRAGFYDRRDTLPGYFITKPEIERQNPHRTTDLFQRVSGLIVANEGFERRTIRVVRGVSCNPDIVVDGQRIGAVDVDTLIRPESIAGVEVYLGTSGPTRFRTSTCGVILFWSIRSRA
jgi:hypothetical protein